MPRRDELLWVAIYLALVVPHVLWRHHYYGWWLPNTYYIKSSGGAGTLQRGLHYLWRYIDTFWLYGMAALALAGLGQRGASRHAVRRLLGWTGLICAVFWAYVGAVGGDFMGLYRFALPVVPTIAVAATLGLRALCARVGRAPFAPLAAAALLGLYACQRRIRTIMLTISSC